MTELHKDGLSISILQDHESVAYDHEADRWSLEILGRTHGDLGGIPLSALTEEQAYTILERMGLTPLHEEQQAVDYLAMVVIDQLLKENGLHGLCCQSNECFQDSDSDVHCSGAGVPAENIIVKI